MAYPVDYSAVLADLEAKREQIDAAILVIRALVGSGAAGDGTQPEGAGPDVDQPAGPSPVVRGAAPVVGTSPAIDPNAFFKMSTAAAITKYLGMMKRPQTARSIADALHVGVQVHAADPETAYKNVQSALRRNEEFVQTRTKEWALGEWYEQAKASE